jgi:PAS domain S-box-containing protein
MPDHTAVYDDELFKKTIHEMTRHYDELLASSRNGQPATAAQQDEALHELSAMIEELNVASEELRVQNQALRDAYYAVEAQRVRYEELFTLIPDAYLVTDLLGTIQEANRSAEFLFAMPADHLRGKPLASFIAESEWKDFRRGLAEIRRDEGQLDWSSMVVPATGAPVRVALRVAHIRDSTSKELLGWVVRDTTEKQRAATLGQRFQAEQTARIEAEQAARRFRVLAEASRQLSSNKDIDTICNGVARAVVKYVADHCEIMLLDGHRLNSCARINREPRQAAFTEALRRRHNMSAESEDSLVWQALRTNEPQTSPPFDSPAHGTEATTNRSLFTAVRLSGARNALALPLSAGGKVMGVMVVMGTSPNARFGVEDIGVLLEIATRLGLSISHTQLFKQLERANQEKADFLGVLSHELRTPLTAVLGYSELLLSGIPQPLPDIARDHVDRIRTCAWHQWSVVDQIMRYAHVENQDDKPVYAAVDLSRLVYEVRELVIGQVTNGSVALTVDIPEGVQTIRTDAGRLRQILANLLTNGMKFTEEGSVAVSVRRTDDEIFFTVSDTGIGIAGEDVGRIFDPFWRARDSTAHGVPGMGLGLSVTGKLARSLGGDITVQSQLGVGTTFTVRLPIR